MSTNILGETSDGAPPYAADYTLRCPLLFVHHNVSGLKTQEERVDRRITQFKGYPDRLSLM